MGGEGEGMERGERKKRHYGGEVNVKTFFRGQRILSPRKTQVNLIGSGNERAWHNRLWETKKVG